MRNRALLYSVALILLSLVFYKSGLAYSYTDFNNYLSSLLVASSMVFTIMGIWIAFIYPNALRRIANTVIEHADFSESLLETKRLEGLVGSVLRSAFIVVMIMIMYLAKAIISGLPIQADNIFLLKSVAMSLAIVLGSMQVESIMYVIYSNVMFINDLHSKREARVEDGDI